MTIFYRLFLLMLASVSMLACSASKFTTVSFVKDSVQISAKLGKVSLNESTKAKFVHAKLTVYNKDKKLKSVNLNCFVLAVGNTTSDEINVDSIASVLSDPYPADSHGKIKVPVYWVFSEGRGFDSRNLPSAQLSMKSGMDSSCFRY
jgi:hypothetical protein